MPRTIRPAALLAALLLLSFVTPASRAQQTPAAIAPRLARYAPRDTSDGLYEGWETRCYDDSVPHIVAGEKSFKAGRYAEAVEEFRRAVAKNPDGVIANYFLGVAFERTGKFEEAVGPYAKVSIDNAYGLFMTLYARRNLANVYAALGRGDEAAAADELVAKLYAASKLNDGSESSREVSAKIYYNLGMSYTAAGRPAAALHAFARAAQSSPGYAEARYNLGVAHLDAGDSAAAALQVKALETLDPAQAERLKKLLR